MKAWKKIKSKKVYRGFRFEVFEDVVVLPDGKKGAYIYTKKNPGVIVVPYDGKKFYLVNQYRYPIKRRSWEFPAGATEGKEPLSAAKKELAEEAGIKARQWKYLGQFAPSGGSSTHIGKVYLAQDLQFGQAEPEPGERDMYMESFTLGQLERMLKQGKIFDGWTIIALYYFKLNQKQ